MLGIGGSISCLCTHLKAFRKPSLSPVRGIRVCRGTYYRLVLGFTEDSSVDRRAENGISGASLKTWLGGRGRFPLELGLSVSLSPYLKAR